MAVQLFLHGDLPVFLPKRQRGMKDLTIELTRKTSIKDFLEALGIPHPEIHELIVNDRAERFEYSVGEDDRIEVFPLAPRIDLTTPSLLRPALKEIRFVVDANVGKLARLLRMTGFDVFFSPDLDDGALAGVTEQQERLLLTRDIALLKRKMIVHGRMIRSSDPLEQLREVIDLYGLRDLIKPFSRCLSCNTVLQQTSKEAIIDRLLPLTRKYYHEFMICPGCDRLFWPGSHRERMSKIIKEI